MLNGSKTIPPNVGMILSKLSIQKFCNYNAMVVI